MNTKADGYDSDCAYSMPSPLVLLLSIVKSMQSSARVNHDVVIALHINKYGATQNGIVNKLNMEHLLHQIAMPLFDIHLQFPGITIPLSSTFTGFEMDLMGLNGRGANLDLVAILTDKLQIAELPAFTSLPPLTTSTNTFLAYLKSVAAHAVRRSLSVHAIALQWEFHQEFHRRHQIPAVTLKAVTRHAALSERTLQGRHMVWRKCMSSLQNAIEVAAAAEERIQRNDNVYVPLTSNNRGYRYVRKLDLYVPSLLLIVSLVLVLLGTVRSVVHDDP